MNTTLSSSNNHPTFVSMATRNLLPACLLIFLGMLIAVDNSKLVNNFFYATLLIPALVTVFRRAITPKPPAILLGVYLFYVALSTLWGTGDIIAMLKQMKYIVYVFAFLVITHQLAAKPGYTLLLASCGLTLGLLLEAHSLYIQISSIGIQPWLTQFPRLSKISGPLNAVYLALTIGLFGFILITSQIKSPWISSLLVCCLIVMTLPLQSRTLIIALIMAQGFNLLLQRRLSVFLIWGLICITGTVLLVLSIDRFTSEVHRSGIWLFSIDSLWQNCNIIIGCGNRYDFNINIDGFYFFNPHSVILSQLLYGGIIGMTLLCISLWFIYKAARQIEIFWLSVFVYCLTSCLTIGHTILTHPDFLWLITWLPLGLSGILFTSINHHAAGNRNNEADTNTAVPV
jgi:hypothetical protein